MSRTDDISNLFSRFGATSDSYYEFESQFDYKSTPPSLEKTAVPVEQVPLAAAIAPVVALVAPVPQSVPLVVVSPVAQATAQPAVPSVVLAIEPPNLPIQAPLMIPAGVGKPLRNLLAEVVLARQTGAQSLHNEALPRPPKCKAHIVALVSAKGGVGKTTLSAGLASSLRLSGGKTLAIDLDPQNALQYHLGVESGVPGMCNTNQAATAWASLLQHGFEGVQLLPYGVPSNDERSALEREMSQDRHWLARQLDHLALGENDLVILDTPTGRTAYLQQALDVADQVLVVTTADAASFITMDQMDRLLGALVRARHSRSATMWSISLMQAASFRGTCLKCSSVAWAGNCLGSLLGITLSARPWLTARTRWRRQAHQPPARICCCSASSSRPGFRPLAL